MTWRGALRAAALCAPAIAGCTLHAQQREPADVLIRAGMVYDGSEAEPRQGDVVIASEEIVYVGADASSRYAARRTIDASGKIVAPGFIDPHTHPDTYIRSDDRAQRRNAPWLMQGVSTIVIGVDGGGSPEVAKERAWFEERGIGTNLVPYVGFGPVRHKFLGRDARRPTEDELEQMRRLVADAMCEGAFGFSTGLFYSPQSAASTEDVVMLAREAAIRGGLYDTHQRDESTYGIGLLNSTREAIDIGRQAGIRVHFAHLKALGVDVHGKAQELVSIIEEARANGVRVTADQYPWLASGSRLEFSLLPHWSVDGGRAAMLRRFADDAALQRIRGEMRENLRRRGGAESLLLKDTGFPWSGKTLAEMAAVWQLDPVDAALRIIRGDDDPDEWPGSSVASFNMNADDVKVLMRRPWVVTSSDGSDGHPRQYGSFPSKYVEYVQRERVLTTTEFIHRSTGLTADILGLERRGYLRPGYAADVVVLDPQRYQSKADYVHPSVLSEGVDQLWVNGSLSVDAGRMTDTLAGKVLSHTPLPGSCQ